MLAAFYVVLFYSLQAGPKILDVCGDVGDKWTQQHPLGVLLCECCGCGPEKSLSNFQNIITTVIYLKTQNYSILKNKICRVFSHVTALSVLCMEPVYLGYC